MFEVVECEVEDGAVFFFVCCYDDAVVEDVLDAECCVWLVVVGGW